MNWEDEENAKVRAKEFGLKDNEIVETLAYVRYSDHQINGTLRGNMNIEEYDRQQANNKAHVLSEAISKLPKYNDSIAFRIDRPMCNFGDLYRALTSEESINWYKTHVGRIIRFPNFLSSRHSKPEKGENEVLIEIHSNKTSNASSLCELFDGEDEILFDQSSVFRIIEVNQDQGEIKLVELIENEIENLDEIIEMDVNYFQK